MLATDLFQKCQVIDNMAEDVMEFGRQRRWFFEVMDEKGVLEKPILKSKFNYTPLELDSVEIPPAGKERLEMVAEYFPILQVIIGHEVEVEKPKKEIKLPEIPWEGILSIAVGAMFAITLGVIYALSAIDPLLVVVLDNEEQNWICLYSWED